MMQSKTVWRSIFVRILNLRVINWTTTATERITVAILVDTSG
jgi:hypothetical protein